MTSRLAIVIYADWLNSICIIHQSDHLVAEESFAIFITL